MLACRTLRRERRRMTIRQVAALLLLHRVCSYMLMMPTSHTGYLKTQPLESRKNAFGSHNCSNRDEFMRHIRTEQYRAQISVRACRRPLPHPPCARLSRV